MHQGCALGLTRDSAVAQDGILRHTRRRVLGLIVLTNLLWVACGGGNTGPQVASPGAEKSAKTQALEAGAATMQSKAPLDALNLSF